MPLPTGGIPEDTPTGYQPVPAGVYTVEIMSGKEDKASDAAKYPGAPMIKWQMEIIDNAEYEGRQLYTNTSFHEKARPLLKEFLIGMGVTEEEMADPEFSVDPEDFVGKRAKAVVQVRKNDKTKEDSNNVRRLLPLDADVETEGGSGSNLPT